MAEVSAFPPAGTPASGAGVGVLIALVLGGAVIYGRALAPEPRTAVAFGGALEATLPPGWNAGAEGDQWVAKRPRLGGVAPEVRVRRLGAFDAAQRSTFFDLESARLLERRRAARDAYRTLGSEERNAFGGLPASLLLFAAAAEPAGARAGAPTVPTIVEGVDALALGTDGVGWHVLAQAPSGDDEARADRDALLASLRVLADAAHVALPAATPAEAAPADAAGTGAAAHGGRRCGREAHGWRSSRRPDSARWPSATPSGRRTWRPTSPTPASVRP